jgi:hypothetical protein
MALRSDRERHRSLRSSISTMNVTIELLIHSVKLSDMSSRCLEGDMAFSRVGCRAGEAPNIGVIPHSQSTLTNLCFDLTIHWRRPFKQSHVALPRCRQSRYFLLVRACL